MHGFISGRGEIRFKLAGSASNGIDSANIAEGWGYSSRKQYVHFLEQARSSLLEVETHLIIAERLGYIARSTLDDVLQETTVESKMLLALMRSLQR